jgi:hypothetical protein
MNKLVELANELKAARTAWHMSYGVPVSPEHARFMGAIGDLTDYIEQNACHHKHTHERLLRLVTDRNYHCTATYEKVCTDCGESLGSSDQQQCPGVPGRRTP